MEAKVNPGCPAKQYLLRAFRDKQVQISRAQGILLRLKEKEFRSPCSGYENKEAAERGHVSTTHHSLVHNSSAWAMKILEAEAAVDK